jgi:hypothetical protein
MTGGPAAYVKAVGGGSGQSTVYCHGGSLVVDPGLAVFNVPVGGGIGGSTMPTYATVPASFSGHATPGQNVVLATIAPPGSFVVPALGQPGVLTETPLGTLGIDVGLPWGLLSAQLVPPTGVATVSIGVPSGLPLGEAFATQAVIVAPALFGIGLPCTFVVH